MLKLQMPAPGDYAKVAQGFGARGGGKKPYDLTAGTRQALVAGRPTAIEAPVAFLGPVELT